MTDEMQVTPEVGPALSAAVPLETAPRKQSITILIPCWNEEATIERCVLSCLDQTRPADEVIVVDDSCTDSSPAILARYADKITVVRTPKNSGNKSHAQEYGLGFVKGDIVVTTDADTQLHPRFVETILKDFEDPTVAASGGYVVSRQHNWLTLCRAFEYCIGQNIHKPAQRFINYMFVIPGAAGAFRTEVFKTYVKFDHDTITEDLDFTYKLHKQGFTVEYNLDAIVYTQDPASLHSYINQMRRWYAGGWQCLLKHRDIIKRPAQALELSLMYIEGLTFALLIFILPLINIRAVGYFLVTYFITTFVFAVYTAVRERRWALLIVPIPYLPIVFINAYVFIEQFIKEVILRRKHLVWFKPERIHI